MVVFFSILHYKSHDFQLLLSWINSKTSLWVIRKFSFPPSTSGWKETCSLLIAHPYSTQRLAARSLLAGFSVGWDSLPCSVPWSFTPQSMLRSSGEWNSLLFLQRVHAPCWSQHHAGRLLPSCPACLAFKRSVVHSTCTVSFTLANKHCYHLLHTPPYKVLLLFINFNSCHDEI